MASKNDIWWRLKEWRKQLSLEGGPRKNTLFIALIMSNKMTPELRYDHANTYMAALTGLNRKTIGKHIEQLLNSGYIVDTGETSRFSGNVKVYKGILKSEKNSHHVRKKVTMDGKKSNTGCEKKSHNIDLIYKDLIVPSEIPIEYLVEFNLANLNQEIVQLIINDVAEGKRKKEVINLKGKLHSAFARATFGTYKPSFLKFQEDEVKEKL